MKAAYTDDSRMPFGKYRGLAMKDIPATYLLWLLRANSPRTGKEGPDRKALLDFIQERRSSLEIDFRDEGEEGNEWHPGHPSNFGDS